MKIGTVSDQGRLVPIAELQFRGEAGNSERVSALVDTGFTEWCALPSLVIQRLGLLSMGSERMTFGNLTREIVNVYEAQILWGSGWLSFPVHEIEGGPAIGMELLRGYRLAVDALPGGDVEITPIDLRQGG